MEKINNDYTIDCPVCGNEVEIFDICDNCEWENSGEINIDGGANDITLKEAIDNYSKSGNAFDK